jgi:prevent-host-death family protein
LKAKEDIRPVTYLKGRAADLLAQINTTHRPVIITQNGEARAVLQDPESYEQMRRAIGLLKLVSQGEEDVRAGRTVSRKALFSSLRKTLTPRRS